MDRVTTIVDALDAKAVMETAILEAVLRFYARTGFAVVSVSVEDKRAVLAMRGEDGTAFRVSSFVEFSR
jgi:hypothetical protein